MINGTLVMVRMLSALIVAVIGLGGSLYLLANGVDVPGAYWALCGAAIAGVVGREAVEALMKSKNGQETKR
jgi:hypothetical protein